MRILARTGPVICLLLACFVFVTTLVARSHARRIDGVVTSINAFSMVVQMSDTELPVTIDLAPSTRYLKNRGAGTIADLQAGTAVSVYARESEHGVRALSIAFARASEQGHGKRPQPSDASDFQMA